MRVAATARPRRARAWPGAPQDRERACARATAGRRLGPPRRCRPPPGRRFAYRYVAAARPSLTRRLGAPRRRRAWRPWRPDTRAAPKASAGGGGLRRAWHWARRTAPSRAVSAPQAPTRVDRPEPRTRGACNRETGSARTSGRHEQAARHGRLDAGAGRRSRERGPGHRVQPTERTGQTGLSRQPAPPPPPPWSRRLVQCGAGQPESRCSKWRGQSGRQSVGCRRSERRRRARAQCAAKVAPEARQSRPGRALPACEKAAGEAHRTRLAPLLGSRRSPGRQGERRRRHASRVAQDGHWDWAGMDRPVGHRPDARPLAPRTRRWPWPHQLRGRGEWERRRRHGRASGRPETRGSTAANAAHGARSTRRRRSRPTLPARRWRV
eukprot:scaffold15200_cov111-Isochrysis_galbana.AAC.4